MKKAFLVGINAYTQSALRGCVNDVNSVFTLLEAKGFAGNIRLITDKDATKANILAGLSWLTADVRPGDQLVFHYSGHGSQVSDSSRDEADFRDEIICPVDVFSGNFITDDQLKQAFSLPSGITVDVFLDCCHSGTGLRDFVVEPVENDVVGNRYLDPSLFDSGIDEEKEFRNSMRDFVLLPTNNITLWSGCRDTQTSADAYIGGKYCGAFTFSLLEAIKAHPGVSRKQLDKYITASLKSRNFAQVPQLETDTISGDKVVF